MSGIIDKSFAPNWQVCTTLFYVQFSISVFILATSSYFFPKSIDEGFESDTSKNYLACKNQIDIFAKQKFPPNCPFELQCDESKFRPVLNSTDLQIIFENQKIEIPTVDNFTDPETNKTSSRTIVETVEISYKPVNLPCNYKHPIIIAFTDINYLPAAKKWMTRVRALNYKNIRLYAMDDMVYQKMKIDTKTPKNQSAFFEPEEVFMADFKIKEMGWHGRAYTQYGDGTKQVYGKNSPTLYRVRELWKAWDVRIKVLYSLLKEGYSVIVSDIDSLWMEYLDPDSFPANVDMVHTQAGPWPHDCKG